MIMIVIMPRKNVFDAKIIMLIVIVIKSVLMLIIMLTVIMIKSILMGNSSLLWYWLWLECFDAKHYVDNDCYCDFD